MKINMTHLRQLEADQAGQGFLRMDVRVVAIGPFRQGKAILLYVPIFERATTVKEDVLCLFLPVIL